jgi:aminoglycoside phosphotransferase (APT) family kinase protein
MSTGSVLARTLAAEIQVGSNRRGEASGAAWLYALPRLAFDSIACVGRPTDATLAALVQAGSSLLIVDRSPADRQYVDDVARRKEWTNIRSVDDPAGLDELPPVDLLVVTEGQAQETVTAVAGTLAARLRPDVIAVLPAGIVDPLTDADRETIDLVVAPAWGEARWVAPRTDEAMHATMRGMTLEMRPVSHRPFAGIVRGMRPLVSRIFRTTGWAERTISLTGDRASVTVEVPAYVRSLATDAGMDLSGWGWGVAARGEYDSQKVLMLLIPQGAMSPTGLVKITRSGRHAARLENEGQALGRLMALEMAEGRVPRPWFVGRHAERALLGESALVGVPFASRAGWNADCPHLADALAWLTDLGAATREPVPAGTVATSLLALLDRYVAVHRPPSTERTALHDRFAAVGGIDGPIPTVVQHGDPGIWNLLVDPAGRTVFLDWEASEPDGLPLWDLLYLFRSYAVAASRRAGTRDRLSAASRHLLDASPLGDRLVMAVEAYRERVGVPAAAVEALIYGCWVHRSLKEATRMAPERLAEGQFVRLIRRMLSEPDAPTFARLVRGRA